MENANAVRKYLCSSRVCWFFRSSRPEMFFRKGVLKICSEFTGEHPYESVISINVLCNFIEITLRHGFSLVNLLHISEHLFLRTSLEGCFWFFQKYILTEKYLYQLNSFKCLLKSIS